MECPLVPTGRCDGPPCPFWLNGECLLDELDLADKPDVCRWLLEIRRELEEAPTAPAR